VCPVATLATAAIASIRLTLAELVRAHGDAYRRTHRLATVQATALRAIAACRTALLGGRRERCDHCGATRLTFNSCRNRHCPTCQSQASARWLEARRADLLPIPYFHVVFTLPHALNALAQGNPRVIYALLFRAAADTLLAFGRDARHLGGTIGVTAVLHTWGQTLTHHVHVHCLVTGGALSRDGTRWIRGRTSLLFPVKALSIVFRAKYLAGLHRAFAEGRLTFAAATARIATPQPVGMSAGGPARQLRILIVEDLPALAGMLAHMIQHRGHVVIAAGSGEEAVEWLERSSFDLVISDLGLGDGMNGWELAERVRSRWPGVRFGLATGWGATIDPLEARNRGVVSILAKPYTISDLLRFLEPSEQQEQGNEQSARSS